jgi:hypothetical protein
LIELDNIFAAKKFKRMIIKLALLLALIMPAKLSACQETDVDNQTMDVKLTTSVPCKHQRSIPPYITVCNHDNTLICSIVGNILRVLIETPSGELYEAYVCDDSNAMALPQERGKYMVCCIDENAVEYYGSFEL